jgi:predicted transglutaminase-like cysteine proteinase
MSDSMEADRPIAAGEVAGAAACQMAQAKIGVAHGHILQCATCPARRSCSLAAAASAAAVSLSACATTPPAPTAMPIGAATSQPVGAMLFCKAHAGECADSVPATTRIEMTPRRLAQLRAVQYEVNHRIDPSGTVEVAWHYADDGKGLCVQYALEKRRQLIALGWPAASLQLATVTTPQGEGHLVLVAATTKGELVLDNLRHDVTPWQVLPYRWIARQEGASLAQWVSIKVKDGG